MKVDVSKLFVDRNPFLYLGLIRKVSFEDGIPTYDIVMWDSYGKIQATSKVVAVEPFFSPNRYTLRVLRPTKNFVELDDKGFVKKKEPVSFDDFKQLRDFFNSLLSSRKFPDGDVVLIGFLWGKIPVIVGAIPTIVSGKISSRKITKKLLSSSVIDRQVYEYEIEDKGVEEIEGDKNTSVRIERYSDKYLLTITFKDKDGQNKIFEVVLDVKNRNLTIQSENEEWNVEIKDKNNEILMNNSGLTINSKGDLKLTLNGKVEINSQSEIKINSSSSVVIDGASEVKLGGQTASMLVDNLPACLFTGASHTTTNTKVKVP